MQHVNVVLYNNFTALDAFGPVEVLNRIEDYKICFVSLNGGLITNEQNIRIETEPMSVIEDGGILLIPGGWGSCDQVDNKAFLEAIQAAAENPNSC